MQLQYLISAQLRRSVGVHLIKRGQVTLAAKAASGSLRSYAEIPGPKPLPIVGNAWRFMPGIGTFDLTDFNKYSQEMRDTYGDIVKIAGIPGRRDMLMIFDPDMIASVYKNEGQWPERTALESFSYYRMKVRADFFEGNKGITNESGQKWQDARTVINQPMMRIDVSNLYVPKSDQVAKDFVKRLKELRQSDMTLPETTKNEFNKWALESMALISLDTRLGCLAPNLAKDSEAQQMIDAVRDMIQLVFELDMKVPIWKFITTPDLKKFIKAMDVVLEISLKYVNEGMKKMDMDAPETAEMSVLQRILKRDPDPKRAVIMGMDILMAGVDSTANSAATAAYYLAKHPEQQEKLYREIKAHAPTNPDELITAKHLEKMKYLKACIKESTRLAPVAPVNMRVPSSDVVLDNYLIPKGQADILMCSGNLYRQDKFYPDAAKFIPERWMRDGDASACPVKKAFETHPYVYMPFGHGVRACPGKRFANMEMETFIARLLLDFKLEWHQPDMKFMTKMMQVPSDPLKYTLVERNN